jgi:tyrosinase
MIDRRDFIKLAGFFGISALFADRLWYSQAQAEDIRVRKNISVVSSVSEYMAAYRKGVAVMKSRPETDPTSWLYWANVHWMVNPVPEEMKLLWNQCQHGTPGHGAPLFLPWHRAFIYFFEGVLREATGLDSFNIPYWDWYTDPVLPAVFREPKDNNPLWHARSKKANAGLSLDPQQTLERSLWGSDIKDLIGDYSFSEIMEDNPHGEMHVRVGSEILNGVRGVFDMGGIATSAKDPIFWLHHANIDRLWTVWSKMGGGRANPASTSKWAESPFTFDKQGHWKYVTANLVDSDASMKYHYDDEAPVPVTNPPLRPPVIASSGEPTGTAGMSPMSAGHKVLSNVKPIRLSLESGTVRMPIPAAQSNTLGMQVQGQSPAGKITSLVLYIEGIKLTSLGEEIGASYKIFVNLPTAAGGDAYEAHYLGSFNSFGFSVHQAHAKAHGGNQDEGMTLRYQLINRLAKLGNKSWDKESIFISFVTPVELKVDGPLVEITGMRIESSDLLTE